MVKILIAGVGRNIGYVLKNELEDEGHAVYIVPEEELLSHFAYHPVYDYVLIDMPMPCRTTAEDFSFLTSRNPNVKIILFSERDTKERQSLLDAGAHACFRRHEIKSLKGHIRQHISHATLNKVEPVRRNPDA